MRRRMFPMPSRTSSGATASTCGWIPASRLPRRARRPPGITGFSQYDDLYANVERWVERGWLDYLAPQLYWRRDDREHAFAVLLDYWRAQNPRGRHVWPGLFTTRASNPDDDWPP